MINAAEADLLQKAGNLERFRSAAHNLVRSFV